MNKKKSDKEKKTRQKRLLKIVSQASFFTVTNGSVSDSRKEIIKRDKTQTQTSQKGPGVSDEPEPAKTVATATRKCYG